MVAVEKKAPRRMFDKVGIYADASVVGGGLSNIPDYLSNGKEEADVSTGETKTFGYVGGMRVSVSASGVYIVGSLPKFLHGSNVWGLERQGVEDAVSKLEDTLHISLQDAKVQTLEVGKTFVVDYEPWEYLNRLGNLSRMERVQTTPHSLYYRDKRRKTIRELAFYDKEKEAIHTGQSVSTWVESYGLHLLRYEQRYKGRLAQQVKEPFVNVSMLAQEEFYNKMIGLYKSSYYDITKQKQIETIPMAEIKSVADAYDMWVARLMQQVDATQAQEFIAELKKANVFKNRSEYTRLKRRMDEAFKKANVCVSDELVDELDKHIEHCHVL